MRIILLLLVAVSMWSGSCETSPPNDPTGTLEIIFKARYGSQPLVLFEKIATGQTDPTDILFKKLDFFIADIKGSTRQGPTDFADVGYISMANSISQAAAEEGTTFTINNVPVGDYTQLDFGVGLSDATNGTTPSDYESSSPLGLNGNYWASWNSYILCKMEGDITQSNGTISGFLYHSGVDGMYQPKSFTQNFEIAAEKTTQLVFYLDAKDIFFKAGTEIDMVGEAQTHSGPAGSSEYNLAKKAIENLANAITLQS
ncbi:MbnP family protein [Aureispira anguillae]|uniref:Copper-binding protein MbnP-like domain-containing protein n=1 Tax=Aureispira anguillae TaxID=2864201 RepID=A0A916DVA7_9BACT|nr:MbnP family protein [Aureispira anguillae]BDS12956.1 hypothetical protein AsAng_0036830 [Aureispira anguillae]